MGGLIQHDNSRCVLLEVWRNAHGNCLGRRISSAQHTMCMQAFCAARCRLMWAVGPASRQSCLHDATQLPMHAHTPCMHIMQTHAHHADPQMRSCPSSHPGNSCKSATHSSSPPAPAARSSLPA